MPGGLAYTFRGMDARGVSVQYKAVGGILSSGGRGSLDATLLLSTERSRNGPPEKDSSESCESGGLFFEIPGTLLFTPNRGYLISTIEDFQHQTPIA